MALVAFAFVLVGCEHVVDVDPDDAVALVALDGAFEPDSTLRLQVYRTQPLGVVPDPGLFGGSVANARVTLTSTQGQDLPFSYSESFGYTSDVDLVPGQTYILGVEADGLPSAISTFQVPLPVSDLSAVSEPLDGGGVGVTIRFQDPPGEGNRYYLVVASQQTGQYDGEVPFETNDPSIRDESFWETIQIGPGGRRYSSAPFSDALFDGDLHEIRLRIQPPPAGGPNPATSYSVELRVCSQAYYDQLRFGRSRPQNPFAETTAPPSNIDGGLGTVGVFVRQRVSI